MFILTTSLAATVQLEIREFHVPLGKSQLNATLFPSITQKQRGRQSPLLDCTIEYDRKQPTNPKAPFQSRQVKICTKCSLRIVLSKFLYYFRIIKIRVQYVEIF